MTEVPSTTPTRRATLGLPAAMAPRTEKEARIATVFASVLEVDEVGIDDSFFTLGGDSLRAAQLLEQLRAMGHDLNARQLLRNSTIRSLGAVLDNHESAPGTIHASVRGLSAAAPTDHAPLSVQQQAIWFLEQLTPGAIGYNALAQVTFRGSLDVPRLRAALSAVTARHPAVRTRFPKDNDGIPTQQVLAEAEPELEEVTVTTSLAELARTAGAHQFDLAHEAPVRWTLARLGQDHHALLQVEHHFAHDGWSMWVLLQDIAVAYRLLGEGKPVNIGADGTSYAAYCHWQRDWLGGRQAREQLAHWVREVGPIGEPLRWPAEGSRRSARFAQQGDTLTVTMDAPFTARLRRYAGLIEATPFAVLMAVYVVLIGQECRALTPVLGSMLRNRRLPGTERTVGMFVNTVALSFPNWSDKDTATLAREITARLAAGIDHQEIPFPLVAKELGAPRDPARNPVFQTCFSMNDWPEPLLDFGDGLTAEVDFPSNGGVKFDLDVVVVPTAASIDLLWRYSIPLFRFAEARRLADRYLRLLHDVLGD